MPNSYVALGDLQAQEAESHQLVPDCVRGKGKVLALLALFIGLGFTVPWISGAGQQLADQEPMTTMPMNYLQPTKSMRATSPWTGYQPQLRSMSTPTSGYQPQLRLHRPIHDERSDRPFRNMRVSAEPSAATTEVLEKLKTLTLLEAAELVKGIEETFGVDASAPVGGVMMAPGAAVGGAEEASAAKTSFDVVLEAVDGSKRVATLKVIRSVTGLGLKEAKDFLDALPKVVKEGVSKEDAEAAEKELKDSGATVSIK